MQIKGLNWIGGIHSARSKIVIQPCLAGATNNKSALDRTVSIFKNTAARSKLSSPTPSMPVPLAQNGPELHKPVASASSCPTQKISNAKPKQLIPSRTEGAVMAIHKKAKRIEEGGITKAKQKASETPSSGMFIPRRVRAKDASPSVINSTPADGASNSANLKASTVSTEMEVDSPMSLSSTPAGPHRFSSNSPREKLTPPVRRTSVTARPSPLAQSITFDCRQNSPSTSSDESDASSKDTPPPTTPPAFHAPFSPPMSLQSSRYLDECTKCNCTKNSRPRCQRCEILRLSDR
ncbi:hypothetical protein CPB83DRAFT_274434 [Crepidotus variabilis]|uniref:Uncharacterized protein n=1 Tax=Crepidotus variabilis TaxID=179855 RepID=A0A9P6JR74_9AGAR|nr:hypothetical protein CPB83DRAFT_274434 [Crepidotus variabilis]